jgi:GDPmannose 4,6-dehydratase
LKKKALITGITGQDGSLLARLLLSKGYEVHGVRRRSSSFNTWRIDDLLTNRNGQKIHLHFGDVTDSVSIGSILSSVKPDEIYNLAAQSHVGVSFETPEYTANADAIGALRLLEGIRQAGLTSAKFYQASTSEMFGNSPAPQSEKTPFAPRSPYGAAKLYAHWVTLNYREAYNIFASSGILFNHESGLRGETFVTRKIVRGMLDHRKDNQFHLTLGNLDSQRDWGYAPEYVHAMWKMLQLDKPQDFVIASGHTYTIEYFILAVARALGMNLEITGEGIDRKGYIDGKLAFKLSEEYLRPLEVDKLLGDSTQAKNCFGWNPKYGLNEIVSEMVKFELFPNPAYFNDFWTE